MIKEYEQVSYTNFGSAFLEPIRHRGERFAKPYVISRYQIPEGVKLKEGDRVRFFVLPQEIQRGPMAEGVFIDFLNPPVQPQQPQQQISRS